MQPVITFDKIEFYNAHNSRSLQSLSSLRFVNLSVFSEHTVNCGVLHVYARKIMGSWHINVVETRKSEKCVL